MRTRGVPHIHLVKVGAVASLPHGKRELGAARCCRWLCDLHPARALGCGSGSRHTAYRRPLWSGNWLIATVSGSTTPVEIRRSGNSPRCTNGSEDRRSSTPAVMETILAAYWKTSSRAAITEDDACTLDPGVKNAVRGTFHLTRRTPGSAGVGASSRALRSK